MSIILALAAPQFKAAAADGAMFELRVRLMGGTLPKLSQLKIDEKLSVVCDGIIDHFAASLTADDVSLLRRALKIRNKLLHCEFSSARVTLNELAPKPRSGGVVGLKVKDGESLLNTIRAMKAGQDVGQFLVGDTKIRRLCDIAAWLVEMAQAGEFQEAAEVFQKTLTLLDRLLGIKTQQDMQQS